MAGSSFRRLLHWGPISVLCIIKLITWSMVHMIGMWWPPHSSVGAAVHATLFLGLAASTLYHFLQSLLEGPGFVPLEWKPMKDGDTEFLQFCKICKGYKAPRSHHCKKCGHCVKKMDHHCPWINTCVGYANHGYFVFFIGSAVLGCLHASIVLSIGVYHAIQRPWYVRALNGSTPRVVLTLPTLLAALLAIGMAAGVVIACGALFFLQIRGILQNRTTIEDWIMEKAEARGAELVYPYDIGRRKNLIAALRGAGDGLGWPLREGAKEYDLTIEQLAQKAEKRVRSRTYIAISSYSGRWVPIFSYPRAASRPPCSDEYRVPLQTGDAIRVTRQKGHWLFGERVTGREGDRGERGWFPRQAAVPADLSREKKE